MSGERPAALRRLVGGGAFVLAADSLQLPSAILLGAYLSRRLGVEDLGRYLYAASLVTALELVVAQIFSRATVQLVAERSEWEPVASLVLRWHVGISLGLTALVWLALAPSATIFGVEGLRELLLLFSLEIPLFSLARSHTHVLVGLGRFRARALASAVRWISRLALAVVLVEAGLSVAGAALAAVGSTALELAVARWFVRPRWRVPVPAGLGRRLFRFSAPLFLHGLALQLYHRLGMLVLVPFGATVAAAGLYGAAESLMRLRRILGQSLTPLVLSSLAQLERDGAPDEARALARNALRCTLFSVPPVAAISGAAAPLMAWIFGAEFRAGGPLLALLIWGAPAFLVISVATAVLVAGGRPEATLRLTLPMVPVALAGYALAVPHWGSLGAALVTSTVVLAIAIACLLAVRSLWGVAPPLPTLLRAAGIGALAFLGARALPLEGAWLLVELPLLVALGWGAFLALGEASRDELDTVRRWLRRSPELRP
jgi:O-antigen/teichoic acid export membrane protein